MSSYPQHDRLKEIECCHRSVQALVDHARAQGWQLCRYIDPFIEDGYREGDYHVPATDREIASLIAGSLGIDEAAFNDEKERMYRELVAAQKGETS